MAEEFKGYLDNIGLKYLLDNYIAKKTETNGILNEAKGYTDDAIAALVHGAPETLDTLDELAAALKDNKDIVDVLNQSIGAKADKTILTDHINNTNNPHNITAEQLNLAMVATSGNYENLINKPSIPTVGYTANGKNYPVQLDNNKMYVYVPWEAGSVDITGTVQISQGGTGATDVATALTNLNAMHVKPSVAYSSIDTITTQGLYHVAGNPSVLIHQDWDSNYAFQIMNKHGETTLKYRNKSANKWGEWSTIYSTTNKPSPDAIGAAPASHSHNTETLQPSCIEFVPTSTTAGHGGYIDFHFNSSSADYTSRIIESASGELTMNNYCKLFNSGRQMQLTGSTSDDTAYARFIASTSSGSVALQSSTNWGVYDITGGRWLIHVNKSSDSRNVNIAGWASIGSSTQPVYFNDKGRPVACTAVAIANGGTGAGNEVTAANNLKVQSLGHGTEIPANANLNTYTTVGNYRCSSTTTGATIANCPVANAFTLQVYAATGTSSSAPTTAGWAYFLQKLTTIGGAQYYRTITFSNSTTASFSDWIKIYDSANKPTANDILTTGTGIIINGSNQISIDYATAAVSRSKVPYINSDGVMEIGRYVDFHHSNNSNSPDFSARLYVQDSQGGNTLALPKGKATAGAEGFLVCGTSDIEIAIAKSLPSTVVVGQLLFVYSN